MAIPCCLVRLLDVLGHILNLVKNKNSFRELRLLLLFDYHNKLGIAMLHGLSGIYGYSVLPSTAVRCIESHTKSGKNKSAFLGLCYLLLFHCHNKFCFAMLHGLSRIYGYSVLPSTAV